MTDITLVPDDFATAPRQIATQGPISVTAFRYATGVPALSLRNAAGAIIALPFQGQQIWDATFFGRRLTMDSLFPEPIPTRDYRATNGGFFVHCGGTAMGNPAPDDTHPLHGELPNLPFDRASLHLGTDAHGDWVELRGHGTQVAEEGHRFDTRPVIRMTGEQGTVSVRVEVTNTGETAMPFMYMAHVNFRPVDGAMLSGRDQAPVRLRPTRLDPDAPAGDWAWHRAVQQQFSRHGVITANDRVVPEFVATYASVADPNGWSEAAQTHPDGRRDFVRHRSADLPFHVRWIVRAAHRQACGFALPATATPDGRAAAARDGLLRVLQPGQSFRTQIICGASDR